MSNHTELLKKHWNAPDLTFIAKFSRFKEVEGFFNKLINIKSGKQIFYPKINELNIQDLKVQIYIPNAEKLINGNYYQIELEYSPNIKHDKNPFSLIVKNIIETDNTLYYGQYQKRTEKLSVFTNIMFADSGNIYIKDGEVKDVYVSPKRELIEGKYYAFNIFDNVDETKLDSALISSIKPLDKNPYQSIVISRFERHNNPDSNRMIANLMDEIGQGMYSSKQRMIFELLQNADDSIFKKDVEFHIDATDNYLIIMHDGDPFNQKDVEAISSAAQSTKRADKKKTGYKGIGFKSVFTGNTEVWVKSGGFQFSFLRNSNLFEDFDKFYFSGKEYRELPQLISIHKEKYKDERKAFNKNTDIPWQIIPIWINNFNVELDGSNFTKYSNSVNIALKFEKSNIYNKETGYLKSIKNILNKPHFILFLRKVKKFNSAKHNEFIIKNIIDDIIEIKKVIFEYSNGQRQKIESSKFYTKKDNAIIISNEEFIKNDISLKILKQESKVDKNNFDYFFVDYEGNIDKSIPPKLASATETEITFGISVLDGKIIAEKDYIKGLPKYSSLFTYLPMEDTRFQLPFLVNADFVPSSDRQKIQGDNLWNKYIIIKIAEKHIETLVSYAKEFLENNSKYASYLSLLLKDIIPEDDTAQGLIDSYNDTYLKELEAAEIVVNSEGAIQTINETILDSTGLANLFGADTFYAIFGADKKLPHQNLDTKYLFDYQYLEIEQVSWKKIYYTFNENHCTLLGDVILKNKLYNDPKLLKWLDKLALESKPNFNRTPFIYYNQKVYSLNDLIEEEEVWVINKNTSEYEDLLKNIGFKTINLKFNEYTNINNQLNAITGYINNQSQAYERIANHNGIANLAIEDKIKLIDFFQNSSFMQGIGETKYFGSLNLFLDEAGNAKPLNDLIDQDDSINLISLGKHKICSTEFGELKNELKKQLITKEKIFTNFILDRTLFEEWNKSFDSSTINQYVSDLKFIYSWKSETLEILPSKWANIPWLFVNDDERFIETEKVYWSKAFNKISESKYNVIRGIIEVNSDYILPMYTQYELIDLFNLKVDTQLEFEWDELNNLDLENTNTLLDWMVLDGNYSDFFSKYIIEKNESIFNINSNHDHIIYDGSESLIKNYINSRESLSDKYTELPLQLISSDRPKLGVLFGEQIILSIIENDSYDQNIVKLIGPTFSVENFNKLIANLQEFNLSTSENYAAESAEHIIINKLLKQIEDVDNIPVDLLTIIEGLRNNMIIDGKPLSNFDLSNRVTFGKGDDKKILQLSDILNDLQGDSDVLDNLIENFIAISHKGNLRKVFFKTRQMSKDEIHKLIENSSNTHYTVDQVIFQILDKSIGNKRNWSKPHFDDYYLELNEGDKIIEDYKSFLDKLFEKNIYDLGDFRFQNLNITNCVDESHAIENEKLPLWFSDWINIDNSKRIPFIEKLGYNGATSSLVQFRKAMIDNANYIQDTVIRYYDELKNKSQLLLNSIIWLAKYESNIVTNNISIIQKINSSITFNDKIVGLTVPIINSINNNGERKYILKYIESNTKLFVLKTNQELDIKIFSQLKSDDIIIVDESLGNLTKYFTIEKIVLNREVDIEKLNNNSNLWNESFYIHWEYYKDYPIYIYEGNEIPYVRTYKEHLIAEDSGSLSEKVDNKYYISKKLKNSVLDNLPKEFPKNILDHLKNWELYVFKNPESIEKDTFEYKEDIDRLIQGRLGISKENQKTESNNAKTHAIYYLADEGYNLSSIVDTGVLLKNIISPEGTEIQCIVRGAKGGLLYLDHDHWDMLDDKNTYLIAIYPGNEPRIFRDRLELLEEELAENILFRVPNNRLISEVNEVFDTLESEAHLILVTSEKMKESLFSRIKQSNTFNKEEKGVVADDNFEL